MSFPPEKGAYASLIIKKVSSGEARKNPTLRCFF